MPKTKNILANSLPRMPKMMNVSANAFLEVQQITDVLANSVPRIPKIMNASAKSFPGAPEITHVSAILLAGTPSYPNAIRYGPRSSFNVGRDIRNFGQLGKRASRDIRLTMCQKP